MKKLLSLILVLTGMVSTASATDYIVSGDADIVNGNHSFWKEDNDNKLTETSTSGIYTLVVENCTLTENQDYGFKIKVNENQWNDETTFPSSNYKIRVTYSGTYTLIYYVNIPNKAIRVIAIPMIRWSLTNNWSNTYEPERNFTKTGDFEFKYEVDDETFTNDFSFRIFEAIYSKQAYPADKDYVTTYGGDVIPSAYFNDSNTDWSWKLNKPSYAFDKVVITAVYKPFDTTNSVDYGQWDVSADAYISKTLNASYTYATLGAGADLNLSVLAEEGVTAYPLTANYSTGVITKGNAITTVLKANTGAILEYSIDSNKTIDIPVSASAGSSISNHLVACTTGHVNQVVDDGYTKYILTEQSGHVGFYQVNNTSGNDMGAYTAYLNVSGEAGARDFYLFDDVTAIGAVKQELKADGECYNLAGQRIAQPTKGLYIVNGKKYIVK